MNQSCWILRGCRYSNEVEESGAPKDFRYILGVYDSERLGAAAQKNWESKGDYDFYRLECWRIRTEGALEFEI
jgi:hypothetical protein